MLSSEKNTCFVFNLYALSGPIFLSKNYLLNVVDHFTFCNHSHQYHGYLLCHILLYSFQNKNVSRDIFSAAKVTILCQAQNV